MSEHTATVNSDGVNLAQATGAVDYPFTNDYMFRSILQTSENALTALICSLLHLREEDVVSVKIQNPIALGTAPTDKEFILDIRVLLNNTSVINLEMQVTNKRNWSDRSLSYLCRAYDNLNSGDDYRTAKPAIHIGFLNFTPFPEYPEFYARHQLMNVKNHHLYSDKFTLSVVDLTCIDLATEEDRRYHIDDWARLFTAATWEDVKMIAEKNPSLCEASETLYALNSNQTIRDQCLARIDYYRMMDAINQEIEEKDAALAAQEARLQEKDAALAAQETRLQEKDSVIQDLTY